MQDRAGTHARTRRFAATGRTRRAWLGALMAGLLATSAAAPLILSAGSATRLRGLRSSSTPTSSAPRTTWARLAVAFGLELKGEANVIAEGVDTRTTAATSRPTRGSASPRSPSSTASAASRSARTCPTTARWRTSPDFVGPCAALAVAVDARARHCAVDVYRRALASAARRQRRDGRHRLRGEPRRPAGIPADGISPLNGPRPRRAEGQGARRHGRRVPEPGRREQLRRQRRRGPGRCFRLADQGRLLGLRGRRQRVRRRLDQRRASPRLARCGSRTRLTRVRPSTPSSRST